MDHFKMRQHRKNVRKVHPKCWLRLQSIKKTYLLMPIVLICILTGANGSSDTTNAYSSTSNSYNSTSHDNQYPSYVKDLDLTTDYRNNRLVVDRNGKFSDLDKSSSYNSQSYGLSSRRKHRHEFNRRHHHHRSVSGNRGNNFLLTTAPVGGYAHFLIFICSHHKNHC